MRQAQSHTHTASLSLITHYTRRNAHTGDETFKKAVVVDSLHSLALTQTHFQKRPTEKIFGQTTFKKTAKKAKRPNIVRPTNLKYGQI